jgi:hypothetical protein
MQVLNEEPCIVQITFRKPIAYLSFNLRSNCIRGGVGSSEIVCYPFPLLILAQLGRHASPMERDLLNPGPSKTKISLSRCHTSFVVPFNAYPRKHLASINQNSAGRSCSSMQCKHMGRLYVIVSLVTYAHYKKYSYKMCFISSGFS